MSDRRFGESRDVRVAEFLYRHEAEFAAGFLREAGIPFRLMMDDAGGADVGVTISRPAALWVREDDVDEVIDILDLADPRLPATREARRPPVPSGRETTRASLGLVPLCGIERGVAGLLSLVIGGIGITVAGPWPWDFADSLWALAWSLFSVALVASALAGKTLPAVRATLRALSGVAP